MIGQLKLDDEGMNYLESEMHNILASRMSAEFRKTSKLFVGKRMRSYGAVALAEIQFLKDEFLTKMDDVIHDYVESVVKEGIDPATSSGSRVKMLNCCEEYGRTVGKIYLSSGRVPDIDNGGRIDAIVDYIGKDVDGTLTEMEIDFDSDLISIAMKYFKIIDRYKKVGEEIFWLMSVRLASVIDPTDENMEDIRNGKFKSINVHIPPLLSAIQDPETGEQVFNKAMEAMRKVIERKYPELADCDYE